MPYAVYALAGQEHGCRVQFRLVQARSIGAAFYARADKEFLVPWCSFSSCRQWALVPCAVSTHAGKEWLCVAFYARADQERWLSPFRLVRTRSIWLSPFRLVQTRSIFFYLSSGVGKGDPRNLHSKEPWPSDWRSLSGKYSCKETGMRGFCSMSSPLYVGLAAFALLLDFLLLRRWCFLPCSAFGFVACGLGFLVLLQVADVHPSSSLVGASWSLAPSGGCAEGALWLELWQEWSWVLWRGTDLKDPNMIIAVCLAASGLGFLFSL